MRECGQIRLATKGASKKRKSPSAGSPGLVSGVERFFQLADVVVKQFEIIGDLFFAANRWRQNEYLAAGLASHGVGVFKSKYGSTTITFMLSRFILDQLDGVLRAGGMPGRGST